MSVDLLSDAPPSARAWPFIASAGDLVYLWGGIGDTEPKTVFLFYRNTKTWARQRTRGPHPPAGLRSGGCCISGQHLYIYGGWDGNSYSGTLYELNTHSWTWRKLCDGGAMGPGMKSGCRMIPYQDQLLVVGGCCDMMPSSRQAGASYVDGRTNEVHCFNLTTGLWSSPTVKGSRPSPCNSFSLTVTDEDQAVMFGGDTPSGDSSEAHILHLPTMTWTKHTEGYPWPEERQSHIAACLGYGGQHKTLLINGGFGNGVYDDMWLLDLQSGRMKELQVPGKFKKLVKRYGHGAAALTVNSDCVEVMLFGGYSKNSHMDDTIILRFVRQASAPEGVSPAHRWILIDRDNKFIIKTKPKLEASDDNAIKEVTKVQAPSVDTEVTRDYVDDSEVMKSAKMQDTTSTASSDKKTDFKEVIAQQIGENPTSLDTQDFVDDVTKAVHQDQQIQRKMANIILKGLPEAGKSTLLNRLLNRPFQEISSSTGLSDGIVVVDIEPISTLTSAATASDNSSWEVTDFDTSIYSQLEDLKQFLPSTEEKIVDNDTSDSPSCHVSISSTAEISENIKKAFSAHSIKSIEDLKLKNSLYIRDTGGQVEFQESLTLLLNGPSIFVFVLRVDIDIHKKTTIRYRSPSGDTINEYESSISTVDALVQFLTSVSAIDTTEEGVFQEGGVYKSHEPVVFIVGTHIDLLKSRAGSVIAELNESLDRVICKLGFSSIVRYANNTSSRVMYTVDNTSVEDSNFKILRSDINGYIFGKQEFIVLHPVSFLLFCLELQNINASVISIAEFRELASKFSITSEHIDHLLHFLHFRIGIIQYYDIDNLSDIVIKEPQVLFNKVTDLLVKTFLSPKALKMDQQRSFQEKGILEATVLESILGESKNQITAKQFLAFMVHLHLAVPFSEKSGIRKYFFLCVLNHVQASVGEGRKTDIAPLALCFQLGHCPQGLFGVLISHLVSPSKHHKLSFELSEDKIYQDQVVLLVNSSADRDEISLKRHLSHIEFTFYYNSSPDKESEPLILSRSTPLSSVCDSVRSILQDCVQLSMKTLHYDCKKLLPKFCFSCPRSDCAAMHEVMYGAKQTFIMFCKTFKYPIPLSGLYWFGQAPALNACQDKTQSVQSSADDYSSASTGSTLTSAAAAAVSAGGPGVKEILQTSSNQQSSPSSDAISLNLTDCDLGEVFEKVYEAKDRWKFIGLKLGVPKGDLDGIKSNCSDVDDRLLETLSKWLQSGKNTNWKALAEAVGSVIVGREDLKKNILEKHPK